MADKHGSYQANYLAVFGALCVFTVLSVIFDGFHLKGRTVLGMNGTVLLAVLVLSVAVAKAMCVMMYFMHLKFEANWKYLLLAPTITLALGIPLALLPDIGVHYYRVTAPQLEQTGQHGHSAGDQGGANHEG